MRKRLIIIGGANGVGKTTFAVQYSNEHGIEYLGADEIARNIGKTESGNLEIKAGKAFYAILDTYFLKQRSVLIESTLSGTALLERIKRFKRAGYMVHLIFLYLNDVKLCKKRIQVRVKKGGHAVSDPDVERRFLRSFKNFRSLYVPAADTWQILFNGLERPVEVAIGEEGERMIIDEDYYRKFQEIGK